MDTSLTVRNMRRQVKARRFSILKAGRYAASLLSGPDLPIIIVYKLCGACVWFAPRFIFTRVKGGEK